MSSVILTLSRAALLEVAIAIYSGIWQNTMIPPNLDLSKHLLKVTADDNLINFLATAGSDFQSTTTGCQWDFHDLYQTQNR